METARNIPAEQKQQRREQANDDGCKMGMRSDPRLISQVWIVHDHPSTDACGTFRTILPPGNGKVFMC